MAFLVPLNHGERIGGRQWDQGRGCNEEATTVLYEELDGAASAGIGFPS
jgi:hypothetical protein